MQYRPYLSLDVTDGFARLHSHNPSDIAVHCVALFMPCAMLAQTTESNVIFGNVRKPCATMSHYNRVAVRGHPSMELPARNCRYHYLAPW